MSVSGRHIYAYEIWKEDSYEKTADKADARRRKKANVHVTEDTG